LMAAPTSLWMVVMVMVMVVMVVMVAHGEHHRQEPTAGGEE